MKERFDRYALPLVAACALVAVVALVVGVVALADARASRRSLADVEERLAAVSATAQGLAAESVAFQLQLGALAVPLAEGLDQARAELDALATATFTFDVAIDQDLPVDTEIRFERTIEVPIQTELPISTEIDTTVRINGPFGIDVPLDVNVPVDVVVPIDLTVPLAIDETIPIKTVVPVKLDVPVTLDIADTELAGLAVRLGEMIATLQLEIADLLGG